MFLNRVDHISAHNLNRLDSQFHGMEISLPILTHFLAIFMETLLGNIAWSLVAIVETAVEEKLINLLISKDVLNVFNFFEQFSVQLRFENRKTLFHSFSSCT